MKSKNQSMFDLLVLPSGINKDDLTDNIILECGEFEVLYSDPEFMRTAIGSWSNKHYRTFEKWINALNIEYNPLENYDRIEEWNDKESEQTNVSFTDDTTTTSTGNTISDGKSNQDGNTEDLVSAFDSDSYQKSEKHEIDTNEHHNDNVATTSQAANISSQNTISGKENSGVHSGRIHGNIGVTTSQMMLESEINIARFNIIQEITNLFLTELCLMVYD